MKKNIVLTGLTLGLFITTNYISKVRGYMKGVSVMIDAQEEHSSKINDEES